MPDKNRVFAILGKLDDLSNNISRIDEVFRLKLEKLKKFLSYPEEEVKEFIPVKFFEEFLRPLLEENESMSIKDILKSNEEGKRYNNYNTLSSYLPILKQNDYIKSTKIKRENYYRLQ
ncbi:MAG: hypothetical protein ACFFDN_11545 [Candidatus Hodarchaeota archaeon]